MYTESDLENFSAFYKRFMALELTLKEKFANAYIIAAVNYSHKNPFLKILPYLKTLSIDSNGCIKERYGKVFLDIEDSKDKGKIKITKAIKKLYFSDLINIFDQNIFFKDKPVLSAFWGTKSIDHNDLKRHMKNIKCFRNIIMHFELEEYRKGNTEEYYPDSLKYFEDNIQP